MARLLLIAAILGLALGAFIRDPVGGNKNSFFKNNVSTAARFCDAPLI